MNKLTEKAITAQVALRTYVERALTRSRDDERGQGTIEYLGAVLLVVAIVGIVIATADDVAKLIVDKLNAAVTKVGGTTTG